MIKDKNQKTELDDLRKEIDKIDKNLVELLAKRFEITQKIGIYKKEYNLSLVSLKREKEVFEQRERWAKELDLSPILIKSLFKIIIEEVLKKHKEIEIRREEKTINDYELKKIAIKDSRVGFLGPEGTFSSIAAKNIASAETSLKPFSTIREIFEGVNSFEVDYGIVPFQNTIGGVVSETIHSFIDYPLYTLGSFKIPIHHCLLSKKKELKDIKIIKSHPQALSQCQYWLATNLPEAQKIATQSTLSSIEENGEIGFIAPEEAAKIFGLNILAKNIEDTKENITRFLVISNDFNKDLAQKLTIESKNSFLLLSTYDRVGVLRDILSVFANKNINLAALHSMPSHSHSWDYLFFLEIEKPCFSPDLKLILRELAEYCPLVRIIGAA